MKERTITAIRETYVQKGGGRKTSDNVKREREMGMPLLSDTRGSAAMGVGRNDQKRRAI